MKKALIITLAIIAILVGISLPFLFRTRDMAPPDTSDLAIVHPEVAPEENACTYFFSAADVYWPVDDSVVTNYLAGNPVAAEDLAIILTTNGPALELVKRGVACRICLLPELPDFDKLCPFQIFKWRNLERVMALKIRQERLAGRYADATTDCIALLKFGDMIQAGAEGVTHYVIGSAILESGLAQARDLARDGKVPPDELKRISDCLAALGPFTPGFVRSMKGDCIRMANAIDRVRAGKLDLGAVVGIGLPWKGARPPGYLFQPNKTKLMFANYYRGVISNAPRCYADMRLADLEVMFDRPMNKIDFIAKPNWLGKGWCESVLPSVGNCLERKCRIECGVAATRLVVAANAYRQKEGRWPADLPALAPAYLAAVPADPYDGQPFRYAATKGIVYSVGKDLKDSGGSTHVPAAYGKWYAEQRCWYAEDYVFELGLPEAPPAGGDPGGTD